MGKEPIKRSLVMMGVWVTLLLSTCANDGHAKATVEETFFRIKVGLSHKGEPIDLNLVIPCGTYVTPHHGDGPSVETLGGTAAFVMAVKGGHAVGLRTVGPHLSSSELCQGATTANGRVPKDWLPIVLWFERAEDLFFATAYITQDAYENPSSQLEFHGATVEKATRAEFDEFMAKSPPNLLPPFLSSNLRGGNPELTRDNWKEVLAPYVSEPWRAWRYASMSCNGVERRPLTPRQRALVRPLWPAGHPRFWSIPGEWKEISEFRDRLYPREEMSMSAAASHWTQQNYDFTPDGSGHGTIVKDEMTDEELEKYRPQIFPLKLDVGLSTLSSQAYKDGGVHVDIHIGDGRRERGLFYCEAYLGHMTDLVVGRKTREWKASGEQSLCRIDGMALPSHGSDCWDFAKIAFENDEYIVFGTDGFSF